MGIFGLKDDRKVAIRAIGPVPILSAAFPFKAAAEPAPCFWPWPTRLNSQVSVIIELFMIDNRCFQAALTIRLIGGRSGVRIARPFFG